MNLNQTQFAAPITVGSTGALNKRKFTGGVTFDLKDIPGPVIQELLVAAVTDYIRKTLPKGAEAETVTQAECLERMNLQWELLKSGAMSAKTARKAPVQNPVITLAKKLMKVTFKNGSEEEIKAIDLNTKVNAMFKTYKTWKTSKSMSEADREAWAPNARFIEAHLEAAKKQLQAENAIKKSLAEFNVGVPAASAEAPATPTEKVKKAKASAKPATR